MPRGPEGEKRPANAIGVAIVHPTRGIDRSRRPGLPSESC